MSTTESLRIGAAILAALAKAEEHRVTGVTPDQVLQSPDRTRATVLPTAGGHAGAQSGTGADCTASLVWSAGAILLEMFTGEPFQADRPLPDLRVSRPDVPFGVIAADLLARESPTQDDATA
ncbi:MAG: hypothetical protein MUE60_06255 [Candidatus Eisenbacteria bacterium]|jgi:hypothetical protein|nr:hypothetical protein [Candidatus Eisenbacteria bacterium]